MSSRAEIRAVIFDWAGTVVDYGSRAPALAFVELFRRHGMALTMEQARGPMGLHKRDHIAELLRRLDVDADLDALYRQFVPLQTSLLAEHAALIPGTLEVVAELRRGGIRIGTTTGYTTAMMHALLPAARAQGFAPDVTVCADEVPAGRPAPWMCLVAAMRLGVYPMTACVKVGDTPADMAEGRNAGMWTVGVTKTGNEMGLAETEIAALEPDERAARLAAAAEHLRDAGADFVIESVAELRSVLDRLAAGS